MIKTINVLGAKYKVYLDVPVDKDDGLRERFGYCQPIGRKIVIADMDSIESWKDEEDVCKQHQINATLRHEVIHAFLAESGLWGSSIGTDCWAMNEEMIDWFAMQFPKILKVFEQLGCTGGN